MGKQKQSARSPASLGNMFPTSSQHNMFDCCSADVKSFCNRVLRYVSIGVHLPYLRNLLGCKLGLWSVFTHAHSSFFHCIKNVFVICCRKQMHWIATSWIITFMTNVKIRKVPVCEVVCYPVCSTRTMLFSEPCSSVSSFIQPTHPRPALICSPDGNLVPKTFFWVSKMAMHHATHFLSPLLRHIRIFLLHRSVRLICATLPARQGAGAPLFSQMAL